MSLRIRLASPSDSEPLLGLYNRNFSDNGDDLGERYHWHNSLNPDGEGWRWILYEPSGNPCVGSTCLFPRTVYVDDKEMRVGQVMFFAVDASHRSLGPAVMLQRATFDPVNAGELDFCYDCPPHDEGMSTFNRIGMQPNCEMNRYVMLLRSDEFLAHRLGTGAWTRPIVSTANLLLRSRRFRHAVSGLEVSEFEGTFGDEFSRLDEFASASELIRAKRSAEVLQWRYLQAPMKRLANGERERFRTYVARRKGELEGYIVYVAQTDNLVAIHDLFGADLDDVGLPLLEAVVDFSRNNGAYAAYAYASAESKLARVLEEAGFRRRERAARVVAYEKMGLRANALSWAFSQLELMR